MKRLAIVAEMAFVVVSSHAQDVLGSWHGFVTVPDDAPLRLALHIAGQNAATLDSADEGVTALSVDSIDWSGGTLRFQIKSIAGDYQGTIAADGSRITGQWRQDGGVWPLDWERGQDLSDVTQPLSADEATKEGRAATRWFYEGKLAELWLRFSPVMQQSFSSQEQFSNFRQETIQRLGPEVQLLGESATVEGQLAVYLRKARFQKAREPFEIRFSFNPRGSVAVFSVSSATASP